MWWWLSNAKLAFWITFFLLFWHFAGLADRFRLWLVHEMYDSWHMSHSNESPYWHHVGSTYTSNIIFWGTCGVFWASVSTFFSMFSRNNFSNLNKKKFFFESPRQSVSSNKIIVSFYKVFRSSRTFCVIILKRSNLSI